MKRAVRVCVISIQGLSKQEVYDKYKDCCPKGIEPRPYNGGLLTLTFEPNSPELHECMELLNKHNASPTLFSAVSHTQKEIREAPFFVVSANLPFELEGKYSEDYGTTHSGGCPQCKLGQGPDGDVFTDRKFLRSPELGWLVPELFASERVLDIFADAGVTGYTVGQRIKDYKGRDMDPKYVLEITNILPPMSETTWLEPYGEICGLCGRPDTLYLRSDIQYEHEKLQDAKDLNFSCEFIDNYRTPVLIASAKVRNLLKEHKIKVLRTQPVTIID